MKKMTIPDREKKVEVCLCVVRFFARDLFFASV